MKKIISLFFCIITLLLCSCGHNIAHIDRGTGLKLRIPMPDGTSLVDLSIGKIDSTTFILRGNSQFETIGSTGGTLFDTSAGTSDRIFFASAPQLNQGNIKEILQNPNITQEIKFAVIKHYLSSHKIPQNKSVKAISCGTEIGTYEQSKNLKSNQPTDKENKTVEQNK